MLCGVFLERTRAELDKAKLVRVEDLDSLQDFFFSFFLLLFFRPSIAQRIYMQQC